MSAQSQYLSAIYEWFPGWKSVTLDPDSPHCILPIGLREKMRAQARAGREPDPAAPPVRTRSKPKSERVEGRKTGHQKSDADPRSHKRTATSRSFFFRDGSRAHRIYVYLQANGETSTAELQDHFRITSDCLWSTVAPARSAGFIARRVDELGRAHLKAAA